MKIILVLQKKNMIVQFKKLLLKNKIKIQRAKVILKKVQKRKQIQIQTFVYLKIIIIKSIEKKLMRLIKVRQVLKNPILEIELCQAQLVLINNLFNNLIITKILNYFFITNLMKTFMIKIFNQLLKIGIILRLRNKKMV